MINCEELMDYKEWLLEELDRAVEYGEALRIKWVKQEIKGTNKLLEDCDE